MTKIPPARIVAAARADLGEPAPENTCWSKGGNKWPQDAGLPGIGTDSTEEARKRAKAGHNGWRYHEGMAGVREGDLLDWAGEKVWHVSIAEDVDDRGHIRSIGAGGPTGRVNFQPQSGGHNPPGTFRGYFRPPEDDGKDVAAKPAHKPPVKADTGTVKVVKGTKRYTVAKDDTLWAIAKKHRTSVNAIMRRNRGVILDRDHIEPGWVLELP